MVSRKAFIDKANQEGFSFNIQIPWWRYNNFKSLVWRKRLSEEQLYQIFLLSIFSEPLLFLYTVNPLCNQAGPSG